MSLLALAAAGISGGTTAADITPDAVNWANVSGTSPQSNANQTISGISSSITISLSGSSFISYSIDDGGWQIYASTGPFSISNGQTLKFSIGGTGSGTITVTNDSDGSATLDTFTYSLTL